MEKIIRIWIIYGDDAYRSFFTVLDKMPEDVKPGEIIKCNDEYSIFVKFTEINTENLVKHKDAVEMAQAFRKSNLIYDSLVMLVNEYHKDLKEKQEKLAEFENYCLIQGGMISHLDGEIRDGKTHGGWFYKTKGGE